MSLVVTEHGRPAPASNWLAAKGHVVTRMHLRPNDQNKRILPTAIGAAGALALLLVAALAAPSAQAAHNSGYDCEQDGKNTECNDLGRIAMDTQREIRGEPIMVQVDATVDDTHSDMGARYVMFSVRHDPSGGSSPLSLSLEKFSTQEGAIFTERIDHDVPNEINIWAHVADIPEGEAIELVVKVGASDRGAFQLETLVMPFDRGYEPVRGDDGKEITMFSFTTLGVNEETPDVSSSGGSFVDRFRTPGFTGVAALAALSAAVLVAVVRRRRG